MNRKVKLKKLVSLNPTRYEKIPLDKLSIQYEEYWGHTVLRKSLKDFCTWLETEI